MNTVRINESVFAAMNTAQSCGYGWHFTYAREDYANLAKHPQEDTVHAFMQGFTMTKNYDPSDGQLVSTTHRYTLRLLLDSLFDWQIFNELLPAQQNSKFKDYVEPLLDCFDDAYQSELCKLGAGVTRLAISDEYNAFDQNKDGIRVDALITVDA